MSETAAILAQPVSIQRTAFAPPSGEVSIGEILRDIREGRHASEIHRLRQLLSQGQLEQYSVEKKRLCGVTFSGTFRLQRRVEHIGAYNSLLVLDIDNLDPEKLHETRDALQSDEHVLSCWVSPSARGLKGLVPLSFTEGDHALCVADRHRAGFVSAAEYFSRTHGIELDRSGSDVTRLCFLSNDSQLMIRENAAPFQVAELPRVSRVVRSRAPSKVQGKQASRSGQVRGMLYRTEGKNSSVDRKAIQSIIKYLTKRGLSITAEYGTWVRVALAIASSFSHDVGEKYFLQLCRLDGLDHDEEASKRLLEACYIDGRGEVTMGTIHKYARDSGYGTIL